MQRQAVLMISENIPSMTPCTLKEPFVTAAEKKLLMLDSVIPASQKSFLPVYRGWGTEGACIDLVILLFFVVILLLFLSFPWVFSLVL